MKLYARIQDPNEPFDGLTGRVVAIFPAESEAELLSQVGADFIHEFREAPNAFCIDWRFEAGAFVEPWMADAIRPREKPSREGLGVLGKENRQKA